jgi:hypothetical protein
VAEARILARHARGAGDHRYPHRSLRPRPRAMWSLGVWWRCCSSGCPTCASGSAAWRRRRSTTSSSSSWRRPTGARPHVHMPLQSGADPCSGACAGGIRASSIGAGARDRRARGIRSGSARTSSPAFRAKPDDHEIRARLVEELPFTYLHVFPFSPRSGTVADAASRDAGPPARRRGAGAGAARALRRRRGEAHRGLLRRVGRPAWRRKGGVERAHRGLPAGGVMSRPSGRRRRGLLRGTLRGDADHLYIASPRTRSRIQA